MRKRLKHRRTRYTEDHVFALTVSHDFFRVFKSEDEMREAWPVLREECFLMLRRRGDAGHAVGLRPRAWWEYEAPEPRNLDESEADQLDRLGLLSEHERAAVAV